MKHCVYCGRPCHGSACAQHADLLRLERLMRGDWKGFGNRKKAAA